MKALVYEKAHKLPDFAIILADIPDPQPGEMDVIVEVRAVGINPGEALIRRTRSAEPGGRIVLGLEFAGVVTAVGRAVDRFKVGDRVFGTGDKSRDGAWAERVAVDHRIIARIPDTLSFTEAASLPIGAATAWEAVFRDQNGLAPDVDRILILGGAGAVGSLATQLLKMVSTAHVISTGSRAQSRTWCQEMGADLVLDHAGDVGGQLRSAGISQVDLVLSTAGTADAIPWIADILRPFGHLCVIDIGAPLDIRPLAAKSASLHTEMVFSRIASGFEPERQGAILETVATLAGLGKIRPIVTAELRGLSAGTMRTAHELVETGRTIGKTVIAF